MICAVGGVEPQTETVWHQAEKYSVPRMAFVNKLDRIGADFNRAVSMMKDRLGAYPVPVQIPMMDGADFKGVIDLIHMKAIVWDTDSKGETFSVVDIPSNFLASAQTARDFMIENAAEQDETLLNIILKTILWTKSRSYPVSAKGPSAIRLCPFCAVQP